MAILTGVGLATFAKGKKGTPYVYGAKGADGKLTQTRVNLLAKAYPNIFTTTYLNKIKKKALVGKTCCDCSGLISWYTGKPLGSSQLYANAYARLPISQWKNFAVGTVLWKQGHVGVYLGDGLVAEERGINYGCIISKIGDVKWKYGLTFTWINYDIQTPVKTEEITYKGSNPYKEPTAILRKGSTGTGVKWLQWELNEAGYKLTVDGNFGDNTYKWLIAFQKSAKLAADGVCGSATRKALSGSVNPYAQPSTTLSVGSTGTGVKWLQWELNEAGYKLTVDGNFGSGTKAALIKFQAKNDLETDAKCGPATRKALIANVGY